MKIAHFIMLCVVFHASNAFSGSQPKPPKELSPHDWAGFHAGLILGAQVGTSSDKTAAFGYNADNDEWHYNESGFNAGAEFGYSYLWHQFIIGPVVELGYINMQGNGAQPISPGLDTVGKSSSDFYTTFRARLGMDLHHYLLYATGGAIGVSYTTQVVDNCSIAPCGGGTVNAEKNDYDWGYTVGGGIEHVFEKSWSAKLECLYFNLNNQNFSGTTNLGNTYNWTGETFGYMIRGGLNYHF